MHSANSNSDEMSSSSGHHLKTRAEQERISSFLHESSRRSNSQEKKSRYHSSSRSRPQRHRHPLDPVESESDSDRRNRHRQKGKNRRSHSRSSSSGSDRRRRHKHHDESNQRRRRRHSSASSSHSSTARSKSRDRKRRNSNEKVSPKPTNTIIMHHIPLTFDEHQLLSELSIAMVPVQEVRIIHRRDPAINLQTAHIEFNTVQEAEQWMNSTQGTYLLNGHQVTLTHRYDDDSSTNNYNNNKKSYPTNHRENFRQPTNELRLRDWDCYKCGVQNFKRRDHCFNCHISREDSERTRDLDGFSFVGLNPCNTLVLRGLDILTSKETIEAKLLELTPIQMKNCAIVKDNYTGVSRGFAFVEYNSIHVFANTSYLMDSLYERLQTTIPGVEIEGKAVIVHFAKNNFATSLAQIQNDDEDFYTRRSSSRNRHRNRQEHDQERAANVAQLLPSNNVDRTNTAAEIAQQALQNIHAQKQRDFTRQQRRRHHSSSDYSSDSSSTGQSSKRSRTNKNNQEPEQYTTPDPSKFEWFPDIGYHFDRKTGFYYDAKSTYFYNPTTQKYMYWDPVQFTYIPVEETATVTSETTMTTAASTEPKEKADKVKNAQKVAKEMELWAKKERERKEKEAKRKAQTMTTTVSTPAVNTSADTTTGSNSTAGAAASSTTITDVGLPAMRPAGGLISLSLSSTHSNNSSTLQPTLHRSTLLAAFDDPDSDPDETGAEKNTKKSSTNNSATTTSTNVLDASEEKLVDWTKLTCLLCQRQFDTREILEKHLQMSNLHKENLAKAGIVRSQPLVYRDRAKERRQKFGTDDSSKPKDLSPIHDRSYQTSSSRRIPSYIPPQSSSSDNIGSKLMKKHGWREGQGLGKKSQGRADPIQAQMRQQGLGLGADQGLRYQAEPGDSYKDVVRKVARARFSMLES